MSGLCRTFLSAMLLNSSSAVRKAYAGAAVLGDPGLGYTVELRDGAQIHVGRTCCKYCARVEALSSLVAKLEPAPRLSSITITESGKAKIAEHMAARARRAPAISGAAFDGCTINHQHTPECQQPTELEAEVELPPRMRNQAMQRKLTSGECLDVSACRRTAAGDYVLEGFVDGVDYCDAKLEAWIWSIGKLLRPLPSVMADGARETLEPGTIIASSSSKFYTACQSETVECVFLR